MHEILDRCARAAVRHLGAALARIWTLNEAEGVLQLQASAGLYTHLNGPHSRIPLGQFKIGQIAQFRQPHLTNNLEGDPGISNPEWVCREGIVAFAGHPLMVQGRVLGVFALFARQALSAATLETLASAANSLAIGLERLRNLDELRRARAAAEEASQAKSDFLANMSHEVRTPISAVLGYIDILLDGSNDEEDRQRIMKSIRRNGEHLLEIINDILDLSKIEAGKFEVEPILCSPHAIVAEVLSIIGPQAREKSLQLRCPPPDGIPRQIRTDPTRLRQILVNLLGNAVKFTPSGWVELRIKTQPIRAEDAQTTSASCWLLFEVEDQGIGMTPQEMARLFRPFTQADTSTTRKYGGTGLGLSISQRLAMALGGRIEVTSQPGIGSLFTLFLPITAEQMTDLVTAQEWAVSRPPSKDDRAGTILRRKLTGRVLLAEDNLDNQRILSHVLQRLGLHVAVADHGRAALERALAEPFDLVLMDMQMPEMDGYAATSQLRQRGYTRPIVALTANAMRGDEEKCLRAGCSAYLTKPVDRNQLATVLSQFLQPSEASSTGSMYSGVPDPAFQSLVREYVAGLSATRVQMAQAFAAGDLKQLASLAHQVKGAAGMYGFAELGESAGLIESACRENQETDLIGELLNEFDDLIRLARHLTGQTDKREEKE